MSIPVGGLPIFGTLYPAGSLPIIDGGNNPIHNVANPSLPQDVATKAYVDAASSGLAIKPEVKAMATGNVASLTGTTTQDGVALVNGDRLLLTFQTTQAQNGPWVIGAPWTRPIDFATGTGGGSSFFFVQQGTVHADEGWVCTANAPTDVIGTDPLPFTQFSAAGVVSADEVTLHKAGSVMSVKALGIGDAQVSALSPSKLSSASATTGQGLFWNGTVWAPGSTTRFGATFYVDPAFTGTANGSQGAPYPSITAALAVAPSTGARIVLAPLANTTEDVVLPATGSWELSSDYTGSEKSKATITGNVTCTTGNVVLSNLWITGNVTGNATNTSVGNSFTILKTIVIGSLTLTATGLAFWQVFTFGDPAWPNGSSGRVNGAVSVVAGIVADNFYFGSTIAAISACRFTSCRLNGNITLTGTGGGQPFLTMLECTTASNITITGTGTTPVAVDGYTYSSLFTTSGCVLSVKNGQVPFRATYYVDPLWVAPTESLVAGAGSNGSPSNPFTSIAAAIAASPSTGALIILAPQANTTESVTFPTTGRWEIRCDSVSRATITGNVICSAPTQTVCQLTNLIVTGSITGLASNPTPSAANFLILTNTQVLGSVNMTQSSNGFWFAMFRGLTTTFFSLGGTVVGAVTIQGQLFASNWAFGSSITTNSIGRLDNCSGAGTTTITLTGGGSLQLLNCNMIPSCVGGAISMDGYSYARAGGTSMSLSGTTFTLLNIANQFAATRYVDPFYTGASNGSMGAPYTTIAAAIASAPSTGAVIVLAPGSNLVGSVTLPTTGTWEIRCEGTDRATITGSVTCTSPAQCLYTLTNIIVTGNVSGDATSSSGNLLHLINTQVLGNLSLTKTGSGFWFADLRGTGTNFFSINGQIGGTTSVAGQLLASRYNLIGAVSFTSVSEAINTRFGSAAISLGSGSLTLNDCIFAFTPTFTGPGSVIMDGYSYAAAGGTLIALAAGATLAIRSAVDPSQIRQGGAALNNVLAWNGTVYAPTPISSITVAPISLTFYVDGTAGSGGNGSILAPFQTIQAAITAAASNNATILVAPGTYATNLTFPANQLFTVAALSPRFGIALTISGTISIPVSADVQFIDLTISGNITGTGTAGGGHYVVLYRSLLLGTFTATSGGFLNLLAISDLNSPGNAYNQAWINNTVNTLGAVICENARVDADLTCRGIIANGTEFFSAHTITTVGGPPGNNAIFGKGCSFASGWTYTGIASHGFMISDPTTAANYATNTPTLTNATTIVYGFQVPPSTIAQAGAASTNVLAWNGTAWAPAAAAAGVTLASTAPADVTKATAAVGVGTTAARADHKHDVATAAVGSIGVSNTEGIATTLARSDHGHALPFSVVNTVLGAASSSIGVNNQKITSLADPTSAQDAATKAYVDALIQGLDVKPSAVALSSTNIASLTGLSTTVDSVVLNTDGMRVVLNGQTTASQNGIYLVHSGAWTRSTDMAAGSDAAGAFVFIEQGTSNAETGWVCTNNTGSAVVGTSNLSFTQFSGAGEITVGLGLSKSGNTLSAVVASAVSVGTTNGAGVATTLALSDHTHAVTGLAIASQARGDILFFNGTNWVRLAAGTSGTVLKTLGAGADPAWSTVGVAAIAPGTNGQALITTAGAAAWGNDFGAQNLTTTGNILAIGAVQFGASQTTPSVKQANTTVTAATGQTLTVQAQTSAGSGATVGGTLVLASGAGATSGAIEMRAGGGTLIFDFGTTAPLTTTIGSTILTLNLNSSSPLTINSSGGIYQFKAAELALSTNINLLSFNSTTTATIKILDNATAGWLGGLFTIQGQDTTGTGATVGGKLLLRSGTGATAGDLELRAGGVQGLLLTATTTVLGVNGRLTTINSSSGMALQIVSATQLTLTAGLASFVAGGTLTTTDNTVNATTGATWTLHGQNSTGTGATVGGKLLLASGTGATGGDVEVSAGSGNVVLTSTSRVKVGSTHVSFTGSSAVIDLQDIATASVTGGLLTIHGQDCTGTSSNGGDVLIRAGLGFVIAGNIALHDTPVGFGGMRKGLFIGAADSGASTNPTNGTFVWADPTGSFNTRDTSGNMQLGDGTLPIILNGSSGGITAQNNGTFLLSINPSQLLVGTTRIVFDITAGFADVLITMDDTPPAALAGTLQKVTLRSQGGVGLTGTVTAGTLELAGGDITGGTGSRFGGPVLIRGGSAPTANGNVAFGALPSGGWNNMAGGIFIANSTSVPTANPTGGSYMYADSGAIKARGSSGTITTFAPADPHCPTCGRDFALEWRNDEKDEHLAICVTCLVNTLHKAGHDRSKFAFVHKIKQVA